MRHINYPEAQPNQFEHKNPFKQIVDNEALISFIEKKPMFDETATELGREVLAHLYHLSNEHEFKFVRLEGLYYCRNIGWNNHK